MKECYLCNLEITNENRSIEHILLNSIGGHLKSSSLLCRKCNSEIGNDADAELSRQLAFLGSFLKIKRERNDHPIIKGLKSEDGKEFHMGEGGKPIMSKPEIKKSKDGKNIYISARSQKELINILKRLKKDHRNLNIEEAKKHFKWRKEYYNHKLNYSVTIGGNLAFKSLVKTAINFYIYSQKESSHVKHLFDYLKGKVELDVTKHFHPDPPLYIPIDNEIVHLIHIVGNKDDKLMYCYIEVFSSYSFIILLSENYIGENFSKTYCYDLISNSIVEKKISLQLTKEILKDIFTTNINFFKIITDKLVRLMQIAEKIHIDNEVKNMIDDAILEVQEKYNQTDITKQMLREITENVSIKAAHFIAIQKNINSIEGDFI